VSEEVRVLDRTRAAGSSLEVRLENLVAANQAIVAELSLEGLPQRVVEAAQELMEAEAVVLGMVGADGRFAQFLQVGADDPVDLALAELPQTLGLVEALLHQAAPIRLADEPDRGPPGLPPGHADLGPFLGLPVRSSTATYGVLYLVNRRGQPAFSAEDENLLTALAATAGVAVENARLLAQSRRRQRWLRASADVSRRLMADADDVLEVIADSVRRLSGADVVGLVLPAANEPDMLVAEVISGELGAPLQNARMPLAQSPLKRVMEGRHPQLLTPEESRPSAARNAPGLDGPQQMVVFPLRGAGPSRGVVVVLRLGEQPFSQADLELVDGFVSQAGLALELADARTDHHQVTVLEDRARIARELQDQVVQRLFAAGLTLQGAAGMVGDADLRGRLHGAVDALDDSIRTIRSSIFQLEGLALPGDSVRSRAMRVVEELTPVLGFPPLLTFEGPLDTMVDESLGIDVEAVLRESLTNTARHARASAVTVELVTHGMSLTLTVADDGLGLRSAGRRSGLANLRVRATRRGGGLDLGRAPAGGLLLRWHIPLAP
jgi:signal transduction histidine kinase